MKRSLSSARHYLPTVVMTLGAGAFMLAGGYLISRQGRPVGTLVMLPAGPLMSGAFLVLPTRTDDVGRRAVGSRRRQALLVLAGIPASGVSLRSLRGICITGLTVLAGTAMAIGGNWVATGRPLLVLPAVMAAGVLIGVALLLALRREAGRR